VGRFPRGSGWMKAAVPCEERFKYRNKVNSQDFGMPAVKCSRHSYLQFLTSRLRGKSAVRPDLPDVSSGKHFCEIRRKDVLERVHK
jgi:hypothetical protein